ncbi:DUF6124 family protein [Pseudomonas fluorescens]|uniref:DUF3077 domain-containing protein n=1 Tax=Pseudomonas fluorescens TaxID=294 RepID=A0A5E7CEZ0_PSEFL|nr:DUF6124 family protein [Pseudomonas fluorescens]VVO03337.1 hypothetical protein PS691_02803 [Pseudomonas fluorescens]
MHKVTPNPPEIPNVSPYDPLDSSKLHDAAQRGLDHYLTPPATDDNPQQIFVVTPNINTQALLVNAYETFSSASTLALDLSDDLEGKHRNLALAIQQLMELGLMLVGKALDREYSVKL